MGFSPIVTGRFTAKDASIGLPSPPHFNFFSFALKNRDSAVTSGRNRLGSTGCGHFTNAVHCCSPIESCMSSRHGLRHTRESRTFFHRQRRPRFGVCLHVSVDRYYTGCPRLNTRGLCPHTSKRRFGKVTFFFTLTTLFFGVKVLFQGIGSVALLFAFVVA